MQCFPREQHYLSLSSQCFCCFRASSSVKSPVMCLKGIKYLHLCQTHFSCAELSSEIPLCTRLLDYATVYLIWTHTVSSVSSSSLSHQMQLRDSFHPVCSLSLIHCTSYVQYSKEEDYSRSGVGVPVCEPHRSCCKHKDKCRVPPIQVH